MAEDRLKTLAATRAMQQRKIQLSADIEAQFIAKDGGAPVLEMLRRARDEAAEAMVGLVEVSADDPSAVRELQNAVLRFDMLVRMGQDIIREGYEADQEMGAEDRDELLAYLTEQGPDGRRQAKELGLTSEGPDTDDD